MIELTPAQYDSVRPLFAPLTHYLTPDSILAGLTPGRVFADDPSKPQTAVAWYGHRAFVVGLADKQARQQMADWWQNVVLHEKTQFGLDGLVLHVDAAWSEQITAVCTPPSPPPSLPQPSPLPHPPFVTKTDRHWDLLPVRNDRMGSTAVHAQ